MKYLLLHRVVEDTLPIARAEVAADGSLAAWLNETTASGVNLDGAQLEATDNAAIVDNRDGELMITDGPFTETKEQIAGFDIIECADLSEAIKIAARHPTARRYGRIEIRGIWD